MTYEEYKSSKEPKSRSKIIKNILNKLFTIIIFVMLVVIISNFSPKFRTFVNEKVLNSSFDFSFVNKFTNKITDIFKTDNSTPVSKTELNSEKYLDGLKYSVADNYEVKIKDSGIVTFIGEKEGYNNTIIIQQSNGYYAWYGNVKESIKLYDYVESGTSIGTASKEYYYVLLKDDKPVDINE
jgi:hypothetical protein